MSPPARRCSRLVPLLMVLWAVGQSGAAQLQPSADIGTASDSEHVLRIIVDGITSKIQPLINQLDSRIDSRIDRLDSRINSWIDRLDSRLISFDTRLNSIETRLNAFDVVHETFDARLTEYTSSVESSERRLDSRHDELVSRVDSKEGRLHSRLDQLVSRVDGLAAGRTDRVDSVTSRLDGVSSRLDELTNRTDQELTALAARLPPTARDCSQLPTGAQSGIHLLQLDLDPSQPPVPAYCDMDSDGGGWTVIQRRRDIEPRQDFNLDWSAYREGFGEFDAEFWWGLESLWRLTGSADHQFELRVNLADFDGERRHANYGRFRVSSETDGYQLTVFNYTGDAGDSLDYHSGHKFSTRDKTQDEYKVHCAQIWKGGWWHHNCYQSFLNGPYLPDEQKFIGGVNWNAWRGAAYSLKEAEMKIRPVNTD